jgi:hypothetical protein
MIPRVFSDPSDFVPHFVPLCGPGGFHGCDLPPVLPGAGNPSSASVPLASGTPFRRRGVRDGRDDGLRHGAAPRARRPLTPPSPGGGRACSPSGGRRRARGPRRARPTAWRAMARSASRVRPRRPGRRQGGRPRWPGPPWSRRRVVETSALSPSESDVRGRGTPGVPLTAGGRRRSRHRPWRAVSATAAVPGTGAAAGMSPGARMAAARRMTTGAPP